MRADRRQPEADRDAPRRPSRDRRSEIQALLARSDLSADLRGMLDATANIPTEDVGNALDLFEYALTAPPGEGMFHPAPAPLPKLRYGVEHLAA